MKLTIRVLSADDDESSAYVREFDPDANEGRGHVGLTGDPKKAKTFGSQREAWEFWRQQSKVRPLRPDGKPNRPLTAFSIAIEPLG